MLVPIFTLISFIRHDGGVARMSDMRGYFSVPYYLSGSYGFFELIKVSDVTWDGHKTREEKQREGEA